MIRHQVFFDVLAQLADETPEWEAIVAGYLVMGLFDSWMRLGPAAMANDETVPKILERIGKLPESHKNERIALQGVIEALINAPDTTLGNVAKALLEYGTTLEHKARWSLAVDVHRNVAEAIELDGRSKATDFATAGLARRKEGFCLRNTSDYAGAEIAYKQSQALGERARDECVKLYAQFGLANMMRVRGDLPGAAKAFDELLHACDGCASHIAEVLRPDVLHMRGVAKHDRGFSADAILDLFTAYETSPTPLGKELALSDLAACAGSAGFRDLAYDALSIIALTAHSSFTRQNAIINLIEIAVLNGDQREFLRRKDEWHPDLGDQHLNAYAHLYIARGIETFGTKEQALVAFQNAVDFAANAGIHKVQFEALHDLERMERLEQTISSTTDSFPVTQPLPASLAYVGKMLSNKHRLVETG